MDWGKEKVLITGGGGFLGGWLLRSLRELGCCEIRSFGRTPRPDLEALGIDVHCGDLRDAAAVSRACIDRTIVFHVAAKAGIWGRVSDFEGINIDGTRNIIEACREFGVGVLVYTSSPSAAYDPSEDCAGIDESAPYPEHYLSAYAASKAMAEKMVLSAHGEDLHTVALRPHLIWGVGDPHLLPRLIKRARRGRLVQIGDGCNRVALTHVGNAAAAHLLAAADLRNSQTACGGKAYFISDSEPVVLWEWIAGVLDHLGLPPVSRRISYKSAYRLGFCMEYLYRFLRLPGEPPMTRFVAGQLAHEHWFDLAAARRDLGYEPVINLDQAMEAMLEKLG